jgi:hypothetical protein
MDDWILRAAYVVGDLMSCADLASDLLCGTPESNGSTLDALSGRTLQTELWLVTNPCPDGTQGRIFQEAAELLSDIGRLVEMFGGDVGAAGADSVAGMVDRACELVEQLKVLTMVLAR